MKVMILSDVPWRNDNSVGNSLSSIFSGMEDSIEFSNIYLKSGKPDNSICSKYFMITEKSLIRSLFRLEPSGREITNSTNEESISLKENEQKAFDFARKKRWRILFYIRELIWKICRWKTKELDTFLESVSPDLIFLLLNNTVYSNSVAEYVKKKTNKPMVAYIWDDVYGLEALNDGKRADGYQKSKQKIMRKMIDSCEYLYTITDIQKQKYQHYFNKECKILTKGDVFEELPDLNTHNSEAIKLLYTGNIGDGRWKSLSELGKAISEINETHTVFSFDIYTLTPISTEIEQAFKSLSGVNLMGGISSNEVNTVQKQADILVHAESFDEDEKRAVKQSFSTKIVDYFKKAKTILAIGPDDVASIDYLKKNDAAIVITDTKEILNKLNDILDNKELLNTYALKSWECGKKNHQITQIQRNLFDDFDKIKNRA